MTAATSSRYQPPSLQAAEKSVEAVVSMGSPVIRGGQDPSGKYQPYGWVERLSVAGADLSRGSVRSRATVPGRRGLAWPYGRPSPRLADGMRCVACGSEAVT